MADKKGVGPKVERRPMLVHVTDATRLLIAQLGVRRMEKGAGYRETTQAAIVETAIELLAAKELGTAGTAPTPVPVVIDPTSIPLMIRAMLLAEYCGGTVTEAMVDGIEKAILAKGKPLPYTSWVQDNTLPAPEKVEEPAEEPPQ